MCSGKLPEKALTGTVPKIDFLYWVAVRKANLLEARMGVAVCALASDASDRDCLACISLE